jgi:hypothetical protein
MSELRFNVYRLQVAKIEIGVPRVPGAVQHEQSVCAFQSAMP